MKKMLINATQEEEVRIALVQDKELLDLDIEQRRNDNKKSNIYIGKISRIESSLEACFVDYGEGRDGFLPFKDIHESYFVRKGAEIKDRLEVGQKLIVQVAREERGNKGAALTTYIAIASTFLVLMPNSPEVDGISRRLSAGDRDNLRAKLAELNVPEGQGLIVRTAGVGCSTEELRYDLKILHFIWEKIQEYAAEHDEVGILHHESETIIRVIRDYLTKDVGEIVVDSQEAYEKADHYLRLVRPKSKPTLTLYKPERNKNIGLFAAYDLERQIDTAFERTVKLKSGGAIVIDTTEALTAIDVNSSRFTQGGDIESTALYTNLEAAEEIARQLKIRDLGGLIVIDFIDMSHSSNQKKVEEKMRQATADDRARIQTSRISKFGLMEVSRQRIRGSIAESNNHQCPRCNGTGFIRDNESLTLHILRQIVEELNKRTGRLAKLHVVVPNVIAAYLLNEKREDLMKIQATNNVEVVVVPDADMQTPHFTIHRVRRGDQVKDRESYFLVDHYQEVNRLNQRKQNLKDKAEDKGSTHNQSSVPDSYVEKTFEARLEKADFIQEALEKEARDKTLLGRFRQWLVGLFTFKRAEKVEVEKVVTRSESRKKKRNKKQEAQQAVEASTTENSASTTEEKPLSKRQQRKLLKEKNKAKVVEAADVKSVADEKEVEKPSKAEKASKAKVIDDGYVTEEVFASGKERKRKAKKVADKAIGDINPAEVKAQVEAKEREELQAQEKANKEVPSKAKAQRKEEASKEVKEAKENVSTAEVTKEEVTTTSVQPATVKEPAPKKEKRRKSSDVVNRVVLRLDEADYNELGEAIYLSESSDGINFTPLEFSKVIASDVDNISLSRDISATLPVSNRVNAILKVYDGELINGNSTVTTQKERKEFSKTETVSNKSSGSLRSLVFQAPQPCVNFKYSYKEIQIAKKALKDQRAKLLKAEKKLAQKNSKSVPIGAIPGKLKGNNKEVLENSTNMKQSPISKELRNAVNLDMPLKLDSLNMPQVQKQQKQANSGKQSSPTVEKEKATTAKPVATEITPPVVAENKVVAPEVKSPKEQPKEQEVAQKPDRTDNSATKKVKLEEKTVQTEKQKEKNLFDSLEDNTEELKVIKALLTKAYANRLELDSAVFEKYNLSKGENNNLMTSSSYSKLIEYYLAKKADAVVSNFDNITVSFAELIDDAVITGNNVLMTLLAHEQMQLIKFREEVTPAFYEKVEQLRKYLRELIKDKLYFDNGKDIKRFNKHLNKAWEAYKEVITMNPEMLLHIRAQYFVEEQYKTFLSQGEIAKRSLKTQQARN